MTNDLIVIIDYGMGNLRSVINKVKKVQSNVVISASPEDILKASRLVLPGVGHFANGMKNLKEYGLLEILNEKARGEKTPILGICLGMQLFSSHSEEGDVDGLNWLNARTIRFRLDQQRNKLKVPHMGWNSICKKKESALISGINEGDLFYFVHSYHVLCNDPADELTSTIYGYEFTSAVEHENIFGTQFHPEKSHDSGIQMLKNFICLDRE